MTDNINLERLQLALPRIGSLLFAGSALYIGFIDPCVCSSHKEEREKLAHWLAMYHKNKMIMASLALGSSLFGVNAYRLTNEPLWLCGSLTVFSILPFTFLAIMNINKKLSQDQEASKRGIKNPGITERLYKWVYRHRVRAFLALLSAAIFYIAEGKSSTVSSVKEIQIIHPIIKQGIIAKAPGILVPVAPST